MIDVSGFTQGGITTFGANGDQFAIVAAAVIPNYSINGGLPYTPAAASYFVFGPSQGSNEAPSNVLLKGDFAIGPSWKPAITPLTISGLGDDGLNHKLLFSIVGLPQITPTESHVELFRMPGKTN
jgi:hypothetical protein